MKTKTSFKLAIEIFSIYKGLISDYFDEPAFSLTQKFTDDVILSNADTLTGCPLDANIIKFRAYRPVMEIASGTSADQLLQKIAQQKAVLIFSAIFAKRGNLNLDLNLDLHAYKIKKK